MRRGPTGHFVPLPTAGERCRAFVPKPLPPEPPLALADDLLDLWSRAHLALGRLDGLTAVLPNPAGAGSACSSRAGGLPAKATNHPR